MGLPCVVNAAFSARSAAVPGFRLVCSPPGRSGSSEVMWTRLVLSSHHAWTLNVMYLRRLGSVSP